jgi:cytoskeletal protein RodZ
MDVSAFIAAVLFQLTRTVKIKEALSPVRDRLSGVSYLILTAVFLIIVGGLGWCFYRAAAAAGNSAEAQSPDEVGDER